MNYMQTIETWHKQTHADLQAIAWKWQEVYRPETELPVEKVRKVTGGIPLIGETTADV